MVNLALLYDPSLARLTHCFDHETDHSHRPISMADIDVLVHISASSIIVALICLCLEFTKWHGVVKYLRRFVQTIRVRIRMLKLKVVQLKSFRFKARYR